MRPVLLLLLLLLNSAALAIAYNPGDRVWVSIYTSNPADDGYAIGRIEKIMPDGDLFVIINKVVAGKGRTLAGTCHPSAKSPLAGAEIIEPDEERLHLEQRFKPSEVHPYKRGWHEFLQRENLATVMQRGLSGYFGLSSDILRKNAATASSLQLAEVANGMELMALAEDASGNGIGFPSPLEQRATRLATALRKIQQQLEQDDLAYTQVLARHAKFDTDDTISLSARVTLLFLQQVQQDMRELELKIGNYQIATKQIEALNKIYPNFIQLLTRNGTQDYQGKSQQAWLATDDSTWPRLP